MTNLREAAQMALDALESWQKTCLDCGRPSEELGRATQPLQILRAALAQPETPYLTGARLFREGKGISFIQTAVRTDADIGEALQGWEDAKTSEEIAQPEQEPVAWMTHHEPPMIFPTRSEALLYCEEHEVPVPLYTAPPQREWQGLTDEEIEDACWTEVDQRLRSFTRAIEAKLKEKNA